MIENSLPWGKTGLTRTLVRMAGVAALICIQSIFSVHAMNENPFSWFQATRGWGTLPIPQPLDFEITDLLESWMKLNSSQREEAARQISHEQRWSLLAYGERMASLSVRTSDAKLIHLGLVAVGIDGWRGDWRDNLLIVSLLYDAANRIGVDPGPIFENAAALLADRAASGIREYLLRPTEKKTIKVMGYIAGSDSDGFRYVRTW